MIDTQDTVYEFIENLPRNEVDDTMWRLEYPYSTTHCLMNHLFTQYPAAPLLADAHIQNEKTERLYRLFLRWINETIKQRSQVITWDYSKVFVRGHIIYFLDIPLLKFDVLPDHFWIRTNRMKERTQSWHSTDLLWRIVLANALVNCQQWIRNN